MLKLAIVFSDNMVLQQLTKLPVWGNTSPETMVTVRFAGQKKTTQADTNGDWRVNLASLSASPTPQTMKITADDSTKSAITLRNILIGEVWVCSGQSNMAFSVSRAKNGEQESATANFPDIRLLTIPQQTAETPQKYITASSWQVCSPETVSGFSAVGYFFGRELHQRLDVPVGLINSSWGGTVAEAWTSRKTLLKNPALSELVKKYDIDVANSQELTARYKAGLQAIEQKTQDTKNEGYPLGWADIPNPSGEWNDMELPALWQSCGLDFNGILWFRKELELPPEWLGKDLQLSIGATDKSDVTYFNNVQVGSLTMAERPDSWCTLRSYIIPASVLKPGKNAIAVRVHSDKLGGGMTGPAVAMKLSCPALEKSSPIPLAGIWKYAVESNYGKIEIPVIPPADNPNSPSVLFNGMISPLIPFAIRGAIWYQGESNASRATQYQTLFPALIQDWRNNWNQGEFPFIFVQLANFRAELPSPAESEWAALREAQTMTLQLPNTGMAVAIDIGDALDIHPINKQDVGLRLALNALAKVYGQPIAYSGPTFKKQIKEGKSLTIYFEHINGGLKCKGKELLGFAIAGIDRKFVWADAKINGNTVIVSSPEISEPEFVRYAWADNPAGNLYNAANLPAVPFRTDTP
ncbi:MAG: sialate O-acetylesterase [Victivallaceae bacterium]